MRSIPLYDTRREYYYPLTCTQNSVLNYFPFQGFAASLYVVEITVFPWRNQQLKTEKGQLHLNLHPVYEDEEGKCYFRRQASLVQVRKCLLGLWWVICYISSSVHTVSQVNSPFVTKME